MALLLVEQMMHPDRQEAGIDSLADLIIDTHDVDDPSKLAALALTVAPFIASRDQHARCETVLASAVSRVSLQDSQSKLVLAALHGQLALRRRDRGRKFLDAVGACLDLLSQVNVSECAHSSSTENSFGTSVAVAERMVETIRHAAWSLVPGEPFIDEAAHGALPGEQHARVMGWTHDTLLIASEAANQYDRWLDELFKAEFQRAAIVTWGRSEPDLFYQTLELELQAHKSVYAYRRQLGLMRIVRSLPSLRRPDMSDCLRLLRHAEAEKELELLVDRLLRGGPLDAVATDSRQIITNRLSDADIRSVELTVLGAGADLLSQVEAEAALASVLGLIEQGGPRATPGAFRERSKRLEAAWQAAASLGNAAGASSTVADRLLEQLNVIGLQDELWDRVVARTIRRINWQDVAQPVRDRWEDFANGRQDSPSTTIQETRLALKMPPDRSSVPEASLDWAVDEINKHIRLGSQMPREQAAQILDLALADMRVIAKNAAAGRFSGYSIDAAEIAAHAMSYLPGVGNEIWGEVLDFLTNTGIARSDRTLGFDTLKAVEIPVPGELVEMYRQRVLSAIIANDISFVAPDVSFVPYPAALRFAFAHGFISEDEAFTFVAQLLSIREPNAIEEAAATISSFSLRSNASWIQTMAVQLSHDFNPRVRSEVIYALGRLAGSYADGSSIAYRRLTELLNEDGISVPSNALAATSHIRTIPHEMLATIRSLQANHPSKRIRQQAAVIATKAVGPADSS
jgi:hypothetical protein